MCPYNHLSFNVTGNLRPGQSKQTFWLDTKMLQIAIVTFLSILLNLEVLFYNYYLQQQHQLQIKSSTIMQWIITTFTYNINGKPQHNYHNFGQRILSSFNIKRSVIWYYVYVRAFCRFIWLFFFSNLLAAPQLAIVNSK